MGHRTATPPMNAEAAIATAIVLLNLGTIAIVNPIPGEASPEMAVANPSDGPDITDDTPSAGVCRVFRDISG
ncbi:hypothetical protein A5761_29645 [Mycolicibacterium setense]|nr:hypothetical protein A5761_29645 [Mycolicibacterium setense]